MSGRAGTKWAHPCASATRASSNSRIRVPAKSVLKTRAPCGARITTCRPSSSAPRSNGCGSRCVRSIFRCTLTSARGWLRITARSVVPPDGPIPPTCSAIPGRSSGATFTPCSACRKTAGASTSVPAQGEESRCPRHGALRRRLLYLDGFRAAAQDFLGAFAVHQARDRDVVCHASAWDIDNQDDLRIKMCIQVRDVDFVIIHHELGHNFYQRAYKASALPVREWRQ